VVDYVTASSTVVSECSNESVINTGANLLTLSKNNCVMFFYDNCVDVIWNEVEWIN